MIEQQPHDPQRQAREQVAQIVREIEALTDAGGPPETYFPAFLSRLVAVLGAEAGAVWLRDPNRRLGLACEVNLAGTGFHEQPDARPRNDRILAHMLDKGEARILAADEEHELVAPTRHVLLLAALQRSKECVGVVEIFQRPDSPRDARPGYLQFMEQMCGHASRYLQEQDAARTQTTPAEFWKQFERFLLQMQRSLDSNEVSATAANDGRQLIQCDRTSIAIRRGGRTTISAMSGADAVNRRANLVRSMEKMADRVIAAGEPLLFTGQLEQLPPQIEQPLADYVHESGSRLVHIVPLFESEPLIKPPRDDGKPETAQSNHANRNPIGALIVEQVSESRPRPGLKDRSALVAEHTAAALHNALTHERLFLLPVWRYLGRIFERVRGRMLHKVLAVVALLLAVTAALIVVPWEYRVEGKGRLMPVIKRDVFASWDGEVVDILVNSGDHVQPDQPLIRLRNDELQAKLLAARNDLNVKQQLLFAYQAQLDEAVKKAARNDEIELQGKISQTRIEIAGAQEQAKVLEEQSAQLVLRSPIAGVVATFQVQQTLKNRPVQRGEVLLEVMDETGDWQLELEIPEDRMGHVLRRQQALQTHELPVEFLLATSTEETYHGVLKESATRSALAEGEGSVVEVHASIDPNDMPKLKDNLRIGADVRAKVGCGNRALGYVLFGDVVEFIQKRVMLW